LDALLIGKASVLLGAGRESLDSTIDYAVGAVLRKKIGDRVAKDETIMEIRYNREKELKDSLPYFKNAIVIDTGKVSKPVLIKKVLGEK
ncbi:MAG: pyrimidine-nucleoside phosphorylase, partial [Proteobacteria bacterium]|nr:pyrimidine-nucleoside phosphorylase [Pseudomonadota bacterium]